MASAWSTSDIEVKLYVGPCCREAYPRFSFRVSASDFDRILDSDLSLLTDDKQPQRGCDEEQHPSQPGRKISGYLKCP